MQGLQEDTGNIEEYRDYRGIHGLQCDTGTTGGYRDYMGIRLYILL